MWVIDLITSIIGLLVLWGMWGIRNLVKEERNSQKAFRETSMNTRKELEALIPAFKEIIRETRAHRDDIQKRADEAQASADRFKQALKHLENEKLEVEVSAKKSLEIMEKTQSMTDQAFQYCDKYSELVDKYSKMLVVSLDVALSVTHSQAIETVENSELDETEKGIMRGFADRLDQGGKYQLDPPALGLLAALIDATPTGIRALPVASQDKNEQET
ncbi:MAG: hypothetical protein KQJ78_25295 [Deltaproteobacteria bacterium]|nr:hypothetical protein [Deltaproteobacteria bacterium]